MYKNKDTHIFSTALLIVSGPWCYASAVYVQIEMCPILKIPSNVYFQILCEFITDLTMSLERSFIPNMVPCAIVDVIITWAQFSSTTILYDQIKCAPAAVSFDMFYQHCLHSLITVWAVLKNKAVQIMYSAL